MYVWRSKRPLAWLEEQINGVGHGMNIQIKENGEFRITKKRDPHVLHGFIDHNDCECTIKADLIIPFWTDAFLSGFGILWVIVEFLEFKSQLIPIIMHVLGFIWLLFSIKYKIVAKEEESLLIFSMNEIMGCLYTKR